MSISAVQSATSGQQRASDPQGSAWVSANAGSGKTHVLASRVIRLLLDGTPPERILCLTFTKAAAAEMSNRIFRTLGQWVTHDEDTLIEHIHALSGTAYFEADRLAQARRLFAQALETPGGLKVQTIHAFCESLLQRFPLEAKVPPGFTVVEERFGRLLLAQARAETLSAAALDDSPLNLALKTVVARLQPTDFDKVLREILSKRRNAGAHDAADAVAAKLRALHGLAAEETPESALAGALDGHRDLGPYREIAKALAASSANDRAAAERILALTQADGEEALFQGICRVFLTKELKTRSKLVTDPFAKKNPVLSEWFKSQQAAFEAAYERYKAAVVCSGTEALLTITDGVIVQYERAKRSRALLDFDDLIEQTLHLLGSSSAAWVLYKLDGGLDHILVDEAQDTSPEQWQVIEHLAEEFFAGSGARDVVRTVFAVGDEKQSIFSFQGADPAKFDEMRRYFERRAGDARLDFQDVPLRVSFRSTATVLDAVNKVFETPAAAKGLTRADSPPPHEASRSGQPGLVEIWPTIKPDDDAEPDPWDAPLDREAPGSPRLRLAERIAAQVKHWIDNREPLASKNRPIEAGDILILVRRRNSFVDAVIREFKARDIAVAGADRLVLTGHIAVMDLLALARFVLLPEDDLTLATLLKSPLMVKCDGAPFDDSDLFDLAHGRSGGLWEQLLERSDSQPDFAVAAERLTAWRARADVEPPYEFYARVLGIDKGRQRFVERLGTEANDPINEFLNLALDYGRLNVASLQGFVDWMTAADAEIKRDMEHGANEVRVMTVHGAKGLEANIVILPDTCSAPDHTTDPKILSLPVSGEAGSNGVPVWPIAKHFETVPVATARAAHRERRLEEYNRLLYVAMTRACDRLYVCGYETKTGRDAGCWYDLIGNALMPDAREITDKSGVLLCYRIEEEAAAEPERTDDDTSAPTLPETPPPWAERNPPPVPPAQRTLAPSRLELVPGVAGGTAVTLGEQPVLSPLAGADADRFRRGRLIHRLLQTLPDISPGQWRARAGSYLTQAAADLSDAACEEIVASVLGVLEHPDFSELFGAGSRAEVPVVGRLPVVQADGEPIVISGQVDRLVVRDRDVLVVDYKTNRPAARVLDDVAPLYVRQLAAYRLALAALFPGRQVRAFLLWTDGPQLMEIPTAMMDQALPAARV